MASEIELKAKIEILDWVLTNTIFQYLSQRHGRNTIIEKQDEFMGQLQDLYKQREENKQQATAKESEA